MLALVSGTWAAVYVEQVHRHESSLKGERELCRGTGVEEGGSTAPDHTGCRLEAVESLVPAHPYETDLQPTELV